ncbi:MAG TPA: zf-TFIIB domain-containing protein [Candidatus Nanoarchaeia archaeon]|nr:zf-TFIIB domain-containing protein [Candidatus Nanoarchaeia archaeon]
MEDKSLLCPRCLSFGKEITMTKKTKFGITVDKCPKCEGLFLDKEEQGHVLQKAGEK